jgi:hypothetical protein
MSDALKASAQAISKPTVCGVSGSVAVLAAAAALAIAGFARPYLGDVIGYIVFPLFLSIGAWIVAGVLRLRLVGYLPSEAEHLIPKRLRPWIHFWLLARFGLLGSMLIMLVVAIGMAIAGNRIASAVDALVYVVILRIFLDMIFGAVFNFGIISRRHAAK